MSEPVAFHKFGNPYIIDTLSAEEIIARGIPSMDILDSPPIPEIDLAVFTNTEPAIVEHTFRNDDERNIRFPVYPDLASIPRDLQPSWWAILYGDHPRPYIPVDDPCDLRPDGTFLSRTRHRSHTRSSPYARSSRSDYDMDAPGPMLSPISYPSSDASSRESSPELELLADAQLRAARLQALLAQAASAADAPSSSASDASAPSAPRPRTRRRKHLAKQASDLDVVIAGMSALGVGERADDVDSLVRNMRAMRLREKRARRRAASDAAGGVSGPAV
ncbi:hypothetical protein HDZ31DRAFT_67785 [Schizophyllum fasciatum]